MANPRLGSSIDAHHHLWQYSAEDYSWMSESMKAIQHDFLIADLKQALSEGGIAGAVTVQAWQTMAETDWLLELASANDVIRGVVGWAPLIHSAVNDELERLAVHKKLKAIRHILHDEPDDFYMLSEDFNRGVALLKLRSPL